MDNSLSQAFHRRHYQYRARSCNPSTGCGGWSAVATETASPPVPTNLHHVVPPYIVQVGAAYSLAWDASAGASSYDLALNGTSPTQTGIAGTSKTETAPAQEQTLTWRLRACGAGGCSAWTSALSIHIAPNGCQYHCKIVQGGGTQSTGGSVAPSPLAGEGGGTISPSPLGGEGGGEGSYAT
ncbi:MAG: hypothetical protein ACRD34_08165, partial [Bryobacteraceae bacterium]